MLALVFPGQGSQYLGMGKDFFENCKEAKELFERAEEISGISVKKLCFEGPLSELTKTENLQVCLTVVNLACYLAVKKFLKELGIQPAFVAGHSLGEYSALFAAGVLTLEEVLLAVKKRGELMGKAGGDKPSAMYAIIGFDEKELEKLVSSAKGLVVISNYNSPAQLVISGEVPAVDEVAALAKEKGARRVVKLKVSAGFHSPLMKEAEKELASLLEGFNWKDAVTPFVSNVSGTPEKEAIKIKELMKKQITSPVRWISCVKEMEKAGVKTFVELGPKKVLTGLIKQILPEKNISLYNVENLETLQKFSQTLKNIQN